MIAKKKTACHLLLVHEFDVLTFSDVTDSNSQQNNFVVELLSFRACHTSMVDHQLISYLREDVMAITDVIAPFIHVCQYKNRKFYSHCSKMIITLFLTIFLQSHVRSEVYSSASDMKNIFRMEMDLASSLNNYATKTQAKLDRINKYIQVCRIFN